MPRKQRHIPRRVWRRLVAEHLPPLSEVAASRQIAAGTSSWGWTRLSLGAADPSGRGGGGRFGELYIRLAGGGKPQIRAANTR